MKKQFLNLGKTLNKAQQKQIFGGGVDPYFCSEQNTEDPECYHMTGSVCTDTCLHDHEPFGK